MTARWPRLVLAAVAVFAGLWSAAHLFINARIGT